MYSGVNLPRHAKSDRASVGVKGTRCQGMQGTLVTLNIRRISNLIIFKKSLIKSFIKIVKVYE